jgi:type 1 glutamine amidotransferase
MTHRSDRREFLRTLTNAALTAATANLALSPRSVSAPKKSLLIFTKSSGFEHAVVKRQGDKLSIAETAITELGKKNGFDVTCSKDGRIFDSKDLHAHQAVFFFTTGDLTLAGTDANPPMSPAGKQALLSSIEQGLGFVGCHAASDTFHTSPDPSDLSNRYIAHGAQSDPYLRMLGGEFIVHGRDPRLQTANIIINDPSFPGLAGVQSPVSFNEEWYSLKDFATDIHVIATVDTKMLKNECYERRPYPVVWARMNGKGRVFFTALGDRPENWENPFHLNLLAGGIRWSLGEAKADLSKNLMAAAPGYADIPPKFPPAPPK